MKLEDIRDAVFLKKPHFGEVVKVWGDRTLLEYYAQDFSPLHSPSKNVLTAIQTETATLLGPKIGKQAHAAIQEKKWVNTADHHGLLSHPYFYTTALARSHSLIRGIDEVTVTLPFGGVSLGNDSFPRGFFFHDISGKIERIFFKSLRERRMPVYALSPMLRHELTRERDRALSFQLSENAQHKLQNLLTSFLQDERIWNQDTYSAQLTLMNSVLWRQMFGESRGDFVYLEIERVAVRLLTEHHLFSETHISNLLFNASWRDAFIELFSGVFGSHDTDSGTHFFWYVDYTQKTRRRLVVVGNCLMTIERDIEIELSPEAIMEGILTHTLMPNTALMLILIHGVEKLACGGGSSQLTYLTIMMERWQALLSRFGISEEFPTSNIYSGDNTLFQVSFEKSNSNHLATSIDIFLYGNNLLETVDDALSSTSMRATVDAMLPFLHHLYTKEEMHGEFSPSIPIITIH